MSDVITIGEIKKVVNINDNDYILVYSDDKTRLIKKKHLFSNLGDLGILPLSSVGDSLIITNLNDYINLEANVTTTINSGNTLPPTSNSVYNFASNINSSLTALSAQFVTVSGSSATLSGNFYPLKSQFLSLSSNYYLYKTSNDASVASVAADLSSLSASVVGISSTQVTLSARTFTLSGYTNALSCNLAALSARTTLLLSGENYYTGTCSAGNATVLISQAEASKTYQIDGKFSSSLPSYFNIDGLVTSNATPVFSIIHSAISGFYPLTGVSLLLSAVSSNLYLVYNGSASEKYSFFVNIQKY